MVPPVIGQMHLMEPAHLPFSQPVVEFGGQLSGFIQVVPEFGEVSDAPLLIFPELKSPAVSLTYP